MKRLLAVLGGDVSSSLSPLLHTEAARELGLDVAYVPVSCPTPESLDLAIAALRTLGAIGCNVTVPYKALALERSQRSSTTAHEIGAVNTLTFSESGWIQGDNTDGPGMVRVLQALPPSCRERVQILGSGGAARAVAWALARSSPGRVYVTARRGGEAVAELCAGEATDLTPVRGATLVISALPGDHTLARSAMEDWIDRSAGPRVLDLAYGAVDRDSPLALLARAAGLEAADGKGLLVEQAALALALWTGGPLSPIRRVMRAALHLAGD